LFGFQSLHNNPLATVAEKYIRIFRSAFFVRPHSSAAFLISRFSFTVSGFSFLVLHFAFSISHFPFHVRASCFSFPICPLSFIVHRFVVRGWYFGVSRSLFRGLQFVLSRFCRGSVLVSCPDARLGKLRRMRHRFMAIEKRNDQPGVCIFS
jgi:hypothetical protein